MCDESLGKQDRADRGRQLRHRHGAGFRGTGQPHTGRGDTYALEAPDQPQQLGKLWGARATGPAGTLRKVPGNWIASVHVHTADYRAFVIEGVRKHWKVGSAMADAADLRPGSYWTQIADEPHVDACMSASGCVIILINDEPYTTYLPGH